MISTVSSPQRPCHCRIAHNAVLGTQKPQIRRLVSTGRHSTKPIFAKSSPTVVAASISAPPGNPSIQQLPEDLRNATAIVRAGDTEIYILGVSHVSKVSVRHIQDLIAAVHPDTVAVELCRDRTGLLIPENSPPPQRFHAPSVTITGYTPTHQGWPTVQQLTSNLKSTNQGSVSASEIEDDVITLLSTGLFSTVRPVTKPCGPNGAPAFMLDSQKRKNLILVAPLGRIDFLVTMRKLPLVQKFNLNFESNSLENLFSTDLLNKIKEDALHNGKLEALSALLSARAALINEYHQACTSSGAKESTKTLSITFTGVENGKIIASLVEKDNDDSSIDTTITGLERTAINGSGVGIQPFRRQAPRDRTTTTVESSSSSSASSSTSIGPGLKVMLDDGKIMNSSTGKVSTNTAADTTTATAGTVSSNIQNMVIEQWSESELACGVENFTSLRSGSSSGGGGGLAASFASLLTQQYSKYQAAAGRSVGIGTGAAWQAALESAAQCGAQQVYLIDRPTSITGRRLAQGIWKASSPLILGAVPAAIAGAVITTSFEDSSTAFGHAPMIFAVLLPLIAAFVPIIAPLLEIQKFSRMSAAEIEETVRIKERLQSITGSSSNDIVALWGEDALIKWPGAMDSIIHERDEYMVKALTALAAIEKHSGASKNASKGFTPAYVRSEDTGNTTHSSVHYRYGMPKGETDPRVCPVGEGDGRFTPAISRRIVAVVGTAHVRGMLNMWPKVSSRSAADLSLSKFVE